MVEGSRRQVGLYDLDVRFRVMDRFEDYRQVLTLATPPIEQVAIAAAGRDLAQLANDSLAEICAKYPDRFVGFAAGLPMDDPDAALVELDRAVGSLGALARSGSRDQSTRPRDFFGPEHVLFATDWPFGPPTDEANIGPTLRVLEHLGMSPHELTLVLGGNARNLLGVPVTQ